MPNERIEESTMKSRIRGGLPVIFASLVVGCGGSSELPMEPEIVTTPPPPVLTGRVLAADTFTVPPTVDPLLLNQYSSGGVLPDDVGPTAGRIMVLSIRDASRPDFVCTLQTNASGAAKTLARSHERSDCAVLVVEPTTDEGFVSVQTASARTKHYLISNFQLLLNPEPA
jgi:hypothetical protein